MQPTALTSILMLALTGCRPEAPPDPPVPSEESHLGTGIEGTLVDEDGRPVPGTACVFRIRSEGGGGGTWTETSNAGGEFFLPSRGRSSFDADITFVNRERHLGRTTQLVELDGTQVHSLGFVILRPLRDLTLIVVDSEGTPVEADAVTLDASRTQGPPPRPDRITLRGVPAESVEV
jgi:hypothetical protein